MPNNQNASGKFRPFLVSEFRPKDYIHTGGDSAAPWRNGLTVMAENHNTAIARHGHVQVSQVGAFSAITGPGPVIFADYVVRLPSLPGRAFLSISVTGTTTGGTTFRVRGETASGTGAFGSLVASGSTATCTVACPVDSWRRLRVTFELSGAGTFTPSEVYAVQTQYTTTALDDFETDPANARHVPQDTAQYAADRALPVASVRELLASQDEHFKQHGRFLTNQCVWADYSTISTANTGIITSTYDADISAPRLMAQLIYWPRPGVRALSVFIAARTHGWAAGDGAMVSHGFANGEAGVYTDVGTATTVFTEGSRIVWAEPVLVPAGDGPLFYNIYGYSPNSGERLQIQALTIAEDPTEIF